MGNLAPIQQKVRAQRPHARENKRMLTFLDSAFRSGTGRHFQQKGCAEQRLRGSGPGEREPKKPRQYLFEKFGVSVKLFKKRALLG